MRSLTVCLLSLCGLTGYCATNQELHVNYEYGAPAFAVEYSDAQKAEQRKAGEELGEAVALAIKTSCKEFKIRPGIYRINRPLLNLDGVTDFVLAGAGAEIILEPAPGFEARQLASLVHCRDITIKDLVIDANPPAAPVGEVTGWDAKAMTLDVKLLPGYPPGALRADGRILLFTRAGKLLPTGMIERRSHRFIEEEKPATTAEAQAGSRLRREVRLDMGQGHGLFLPPQGEVLKLEKGLLVAFENERGSLFAFQFCQGLRLENITSYAGKFILWERDEAGPNYYRRLRTLRRPGTSRLIGGEGLQSNYTRGGPTIEECEFTYSFDDTINLLSTVAMVYEARSPREVVVLPRWKTFDQGSTLSFHDFDNLKKLDEATVIGVERITDPQIIEQCIHMGREVRIGPFSERPGPEQSPWLVRLDRDIAVRKYAIAVSSDHKISGFAVRNCRFKGSQTRAILINGPSDGVIEGNVIEDVGMAGIAIEFERWFLEGPFPANIVVRNNRILRTPFMTQIARPFRGDNGAIYVGAGHGTARLITGITIENNMVVDPLFAGILLANVREARVRNNTIINPVCRQPLEFDGKKGGEDCYGEFPGAAIYVFASEDVVVSKNQFLKLGRYCPAEIRVATNSTRVAVK